mmetsp:Transcript_16960/g.46946  ORF Transcript_16960/g.46946 Transcript_16960/m.46946 type:complete len:229 (-) Transcript_16960:377-1063(-)
MYEEVHFDCEEQAFIAHRLPLPSMQRRAWIECIPRTSQRILPFPISSHSGSGWPEMTWVCRWDTLVGRNRSDGWTTSLPAASPPSASMSRTCYRMVHRECWFGIAARNGPRRIAGAAGSGRPCRFRRSGIWAFRSSSPALHRAGGCHCCRRQSPGMSPNLQQWCSDTDMIAERQPSSKNQIWRKAWPWRGHRRTHPEFDRDRHAAAIRLLREACGPGCRHEDDAMRLR